MRPPEPKLVMVERDYELDITYPPPPPAGFLTKLWTKCKKEPLIPIGQPPLRQAVGFAWTQKHSSVADCRSMYSLCVWLLVCQASWQPLAFWRQV
jgi:hypothetical protein